MNIPSLVRPSTYISRKKKDPTQFIYNGSKNIDAVSIQQFSYNKEQVSEQAALETNHEIDFSDKTKTYWLNIHGLHDVDFIKSLCHKMGVHNLVIQDILDSKQRPKFQDFDHYAFLTIQSTRPYSENQRLSNEHISFIIGDNYLISFQEKIADHFDHLRYRLREGVGLLRERGVDLLLFTMLEAILDNYFSSLDVLQNQLNVYNYQSFEHQSSPVVLEEMDTLKSTLQLMQNSIKPIREFVIQASRGEVSFIHHEHVKYYLELKDLSLTLMDDSERMLNSIDSKFNLFFSVQSHKSNETMKVLTIVATLFMPLTFVVGIYGMNFENIPELKWQYGYFAVWLVMIISVIAMLILFKKKKLW